EQGREGDSAMLTLRFPQPLAGLVGAFEVNCVAGCCGTAAFDFAPRYAADAVRLLGAEQVAAALGQLEGLLGQVARHSGAVQTNTDLWVGKRGELIDSLILPVQAALVEALYDAFGRDLLGRDCLSADGGRVLGMARTIDAAKDFAALPVLADAL